MRKPTFGQEIRRLREAAGLTLRQFAGEVGISAPHQSDIEHERRRPSAEVLRKMVARLRHVGATTERFEELDTRLVAEAQEWVAEQPGVGAMLREMKRQGINPVAHLRELQRERQRKRGEKE